MMLSISQFHNRWRFVISIQRVQRLCIKVKTRWLYSLYQGHLNQLWHAISSFNDVFTFHYQIIFKWHLILSKLQFWYEECQIFGLLNCYWFFSLSSLAKCTLQSNCRIPDFLQFWIMRIHICPNLIILENFLLNIGYNVFQILLLIWIKVR